MARIPPRSFGSQQHYRAPPPPAPRLCQRRIVFMTFFLLQSYPASFPACLVWAAEAAAPSCLAGQFGIPQWLISSPSLYRISARENLLICRSCRAEWFYAARSGCTAAGVPLRRVVRPDEETERDHGSPSCRIRLCAISLRVQRRAALPVARIPRPPGIPPAVVCLARQRTGRSSFFATMPARRRRGFTLQHLSSHDVRAFLITAIQAIAADTDCRHGSLLAVCPGVSWANVEPLPGSPYYVDGRRCFTSWRFACPSF